MVEPDKEYELVPEDEIIRLRKEVDQLKHSYLSDGTTESATLIEAIDKLTSHIHKLLAVFEEAGKHVTEDTVKDMKKEVHSLDKIAEQNEKIAKGILKVAGMVKDMKDQRPAASAEMGSFTSSSPVDSAELKQEISSIGMDSGSSFDVPTPQNLDASGYGSAPAGGPAPMGQFEEQQSPPGMPSIPTQSPNPFDNPQVTSNDPFSPLPSTSEPMPDRINMTQTPGQAPPTPPAQDESAEFSPGALSGGHATSSPEKSHHESFEEFKARKKAEKEAKKH